jgi:hypothetical protein
MITVPIIIATLQYLLLHQACIGVVSQLRGRKRWIRAWQAAGSGRKCAGFRLAPPISALYIKKIVAAIVVTLFALFTASTVPSPEIALVCAILLLTVYLFAFEIVGVDVAMVLRWSSVRPFQTDEAASLILPALKAAGSVISERAVAPSAKWVSSHR